MDPTLSERRADADPAAGVQRRVLQSEGRPGAGEPTQESTRTLQQVLDVLELEVQLRQRLQADLRLLRQQLLQARSELAALRSGPHSARHGADDGRLAGLPDPAPDGTT